MNRADSPIAAAMTTTAVSSSASLNEACERELKKLHPETVVLPQEETVDLHQEPTDFSLVLGGPLYQLFLRTGMVRPPLELCHRRIILITLIAWLPLLVLTAVRGQALGGVTVPFVLDLDTNARFLAAVPLLIAAELIVHKRMRPLVGQFLERGIISTEERPNFEAIVTSIMRLRNSVIVEMLLLVFAFTAGHWIWHEHISLNVATWYATRTGGETRLTPAGYWYVYVSLPIVRFIAFRWWFRWLLWCLFLWRVSRLSLRLNALHPDRAGGLGFLPGSVIAFAPVLVAHTLFLSGVIGNQIWHADAQLPEFRLEIAGLMAGLMLFTLAPLCLFVFHLSDLKRVGVQEYGVFASRYVNDFRHKWMEGAPQGEGALGTGDIQSLADLSGSFDVVRELRIVPIDRQTVVRLAIMLALPLFPLSLTMIPLEEMIDRLVGLFF